MDIRTKEAIRYLGYGRCAVDEQTLQLIQESFEELGQIAKEKCIYRIFELSFADDDRLKIGELEIESNSLRKNLAGCKEAILFGATLGIAVDRQIRKYEVMNMAKAVVLQSCAAALLEEYCDKMQEKLTKICVKGAGNLRPRFSPGYGDFSIVHQRDILKMLDAPKHIGLTMTEGYMLTPTKSVSAVIGIDSEPKLCHGETCDVCGKADCTCRRS